MESTKSVAAPGFARRGGTAPLLATTFLAVVACRAEPPGSGLVIALESMPQALDPRFATDAASSRIGSLVFPSLVRTDASGEHLPDLAAGWEAEDPRTVRFDLRRGATFHDGTPVTAADVRATYESILDEDSASPRRSLVEFLEAVDAPDDRTVRFRMKEPYAPYLEAALVGVVPRTIAEGKAKGLVGAGPFRIEAVEPNHEVRLRAVDGHPGLAGIRFRVIPDETVRALEMKRHAVHLVQNGVEPESLSWLAADERLCIRRAPGTTFQYVGLNLRDPLLADRRVRRALAHSIDREALVEHLLRGTARPATGLLAPGHWAYEGDVFRPVHDPDLARRLLDEAGRPDPDGDGPGTRFRLSYKTTTLASRRRIAEAIQAMLADVGVGLDVTSLEWGTFYDDVRRGNFQLYGLAWVGVSDPDLYYGILHSAMTPPRGNNRGRFADPRIDRLTELGRRTLDRAERRRIYGEVQRIVAEELPFVPLWWEDVVVVQDRRLCGFVPYANGDWISLRIAWWNETPPPGSGPCGCPAPS